MNQLSGCLLINKRVGITSRKEVSDVSHILGIKKCGHIGTLDPFASGLLIVLVNKATKISPFLEGKDKTYIAKLTLGERRDSADITGNVIEKKPIPLFNKEKISEVLNSFLGKQEQIPPIYSALKKDGKHYYDYARKGIEIDIKPRTIEIYDIKLIDFDNENIIFMVKCSKGTYVRTLGEDIANKLGTVGYLSELMRTKIGEFSLNDAINSEDVTSDKLIPIEKMLSGYKTITLYNKDAFKALNGVPLKLDAFEKEVLLKDKDGLIAMYELKDDGLYHCLRGLR